MAKKKQATTRTKRTATSAKPAKATAPSATTAAAAIETPADGVRALRARVEMDVSRTKADRTTLIKALTNLEEDYNRVIVGRGGVKAVLSFRSVVTSPAEAIRRAAVEPKPVVPLPRQDATFVPTPQDLVDVMLRMADITKDDVVYDLGSGDGRIVITAVQAYGAKGVGIDKDPQRIAEATANAARAGVSRRATFVEGDLFEADVRKATVVVLYLLPNINLELKARLLDQLKPGSRIVSHAFDMGDWQPAQRLDVEGRTAYLWIVPDR
jgi:methylase of polypeptide subunit release factors